MRRKTVSGIMLSLLLIGMLTLAFNIQPVKASGTIYIRADGSVEPSTANITSADNVTYYFTGNINESIVVERDNIVVDGAGYTLQGTGSGIGIDLTGRSNVTIKNMGIKAFRYGIDIWSSNYNNLLGNNITNNFDGIKLYYSSRNTITGNNITANFQYGIHLYRSWNNNVSRNKVTNSFFGIELSASSHNVLRNNSIANNLFNFGIGGYNSSLYFVHDVDPSNTVDGKPIYCWIDRQDTTVPLDAGYVALVNCTNITVQNLNLTNNDQGVLLAYTTNSTITKNNIETNEKGIELVGSSSNRICDNNITNNYQGIWLDYSSNNSIYHNNFIDNTRQVYVETGYPNFWDDSYPSGGNYWSNHICTGNPSDGSQPYIIDANNIDHYPFQDPNGWLLHQLTVTSSPITGVAFTIDGARETTPYTEWLPEGSYTLIMPETHNRYVWSHWLEDGDTNRIKTITLPGTTWTAVYTPPKPVGGKAIPINIPINKPETPTLWIWLTTIILSLVLIVVYVKKRKRSTEINS